MSPTERGVFGQSGELTTGDGTSFPVSITRRPNDELIVMILSDPEMLFSTPMGDLTLQFVSSRGLMRQRGRAERLGFDLLRFFDLDPPDLLQRREDVRVIAAQRVTLSDSVHRLVDALTADISGGGMLIACPDQIELDGELAFELFIEPEEAPVTGLCRRIARPTRSGTRAFAFVEITRAEHRRLVRFIFDRQRAALAHTRGER